MAEFQENSGKVSSSCSWENRDSIDFTNAEAGDRDEEFYDRIEAPKFVDFTVPDHYRPDDRYWFCLRVGCDQKHEEEMDHDEISKNFILRVMAARSPNVRLRKALARNASRTPLKCPLSAPPKSSKPRLAIISAISQKMDSEKKKVMMPPPKPASTPMTKRKQVAAKYLTTPRNKKNMSSPKSFRSVQNPKPENIDVPKSRMVAKALVFHSPKKSIKVKTSVELRTPLTKLCEGMSRLEITGQRKRASGYSIKASKNLESKDSRRKGEPLDSQTFINQEAKSVRSIKGKIKRKLSKQVVSKKFLANDPIDISKTNEGNDTKQQSIAKGKVEELELQESTQEEASVSSAVPSSMCDSNSASLDDSNGEGSCSELERTNNPIFEATNKEENENENIGGNEQYENLRLNSESGGKSLDHINKNNSFERERNELELMDSDDKENAAVPDENRHDNIVNQNSRRIFGTHDKSSVIKKGAHAQDKNLKEGLISSGGVAPGMKFKKPKPTNPKPFRLRTDERGILKEANLEKRTNFPTPRSENANSSTLGGKVPTKQGSDNQRSKAAASVTPKKQHSLAHQEPKLLSSPLESKAIQRLEKFRKTVSPLRLASTKKEMTSFLIPGQKLDVIHETSPIISEPKKTGKEIRNNVLTPTRAYLSISRSRRPVTVVVEPNSHSPHVPKCTKKLK